MKGKKMRKYYLYKIMILAILITLFYMPSTVFADLPIGWYTTYIGDSSLFSGNVSYDEVDDSWSLVTSGNTPSLAMPISSLNCYYVYKILHGDGQIIAHRITGSAKIIGMGSMKLVGGIMIREALEFPISGSIRLDSGYVYLDGDYSSIQVEEAPWFKLERRGQRITAYNSDNGSDWVELQSKNISSGSRLYAGLFLDAPSFSNNPAISAEFDNVSVDPFEEVNSGPDNDWTVTGDNNMFSIPIGNIGIGTPNPMAKLDVVGNIRISNSSGAAVLEMGEGLDYAEGFHISDEKKISPGSVLIIDTANPGKLTLSHNVYDKKVAGIVAGAKGLGSGVRLGTGQFDYAVALAGRVYCNVDATQVAIEPGDLLTTSAMPGYAMKVLDYTRAQGAILGKAMERMEKGKKGQILVLVTLQ